MGLGRASPGGDRSNPRRRVMISLMAASQQSQRGSERLTPMVVQRWTYIQSMTVANTSGSTAPIVSWLPRPTLLTIPSTWPRASKSLAKAWVFSRSARSVPMDTLGEIFGRTGCDAHNRPIVVHQRIGGATDSLRRAGNDDELSRSDPIPSRQPVRRRESLWAPSGCHKSSTKASPTVLSRLITQVQKVMCRPTRS